MKRLLQAGLLFSCVFLYSTALLATPVFLRADSGFSIENEYFEDALSQGGVIAHVPAGESLSPYGFDIMAEQDSIIYISVSSEFISAACLKGAFTAEGDSDPARPGEVYVHAYSGDLTSAYQFDVERFLGSSSIASIDGDLRKDLEGVMRSQGRKKFWGFLEASNTNAQAPLAPQIEAKRRDYLLQPEIIDIRAQAVGDAEELARLSAERFVGALAAQDEQAVASLLHPQLFAKKGRTPAEWLSLRKEFAHDLATSNLSNKMRMASVGGGSMEEGFEIQLENGQRYHLQTEPLDAMVFVKSIRKQ